MINIKKIKDFFKKNTKTNKNLVLKEKKSVKVKKRRNYKINLEILKKLNFFKGKYIPYFLILALIFIVFIIVLVLGPFFRVQYIEIIRKDSITNMDISYKAVEYLRGEKLFNIKELDLFNKLKSYQDNIKSIDMSLSLPNTLKITIESYKELFNVEINDKTYLLVENGTLIPGSISKNIRKLNIITNIDKNRFIEYKQVFDPFFLERINYILKRLEENFVNIELVDFFYYESERELHIKLNNGGLLLFSIDSDKEVDSQIEKLAIFNKDYFSIDKGIFVYLDLRIKNKVFYCHEDNRYQCEMNLKNIYNFNYY